MRARIGIALGLYWSGIAQVMIVIASISALGAVGGLPVLVGALTKYSRFPTTWLRGLRPLAVLFGLSLLTLQGDAPNAIRVLGADQRFSTLSSQSVARRVHAQREGQPVNILALSGGGAD